MRFAENTVRTCRLNDLARPDHVAPRMSIGAVDSIAVIDVEHRFVRLMTAANLRAISSGHRTAALTMPVPNTARCRRQPRWRAE